MAEEKGAGVGGSLAVGLEVDAPAAGEGEEEALGDGFGEGVGDRFFAGVLLFDGHAGGEGADFEGGGAGELVGCCGGEGLD